MSSQDWGPASGAPLESEGPNEGSTGPSPIDVEDQERYDRGGVVGRGGMGEVTMAWDRRLEREVALKVMHPEASEGRFLREAMFTSRLQHPGIVPIYTVGRDPDGKPYYTMRLVEGQTLGQAMKHLGLTPLVRHIAEAGRAVAYAHERGVVHRDLKPDNILLGRFGETQVGDWGLACDVGTVEGPVGTQGYMSPEQQAGEAVDGRSDCYSLGQVLSEVVGAEGPPELLAIAVRATQRNPGARYPDVALMVADLEAWFEGRRVTAHDYTATELLVRTIRAWRAPLAVGWLALMVVLGVVVHASHKQPWSVTERYKLRMMRLFRVGSLRSI